MLSKMVKSFMINTENRRGAAKKWYRLKEGEFVATGKSRRMRQRKNRISEKTKEIERIKALPVNIVGISEEKITTGRYFGHADTTMREAVANMIYVRGKYKSHKTP